MYPCLVTNNGDVVPHLFDVKHLREVEEEIEIQVDYEGELRSSLQELTYSRRIFSQLEEKLKNYKGKYALIEKLSKEDKRRRF